MHLSRFRIAFYLILLFITYRIIVGPLFLYSAENGHIRCLKIISAIGGRLPYTSDSDYGLLHGAGESYESVEWLLQKGMDPNCRDEYGQTPLMYTPNKEVMGLLLDHGADIWACDNEGNSVFYHAAGNLDCLKLLISRCENFDPLVVNYAGENLLFGAIKYRYQDDPSVIQFLLSLGLDPNSKTLIRSRTPLEEICNHSNPVNSNMIRTLLEAGAQYGSLADFKENAFLEYKIREILTAYEDRQTTATESTSTTLLVRQEEYFRHLPPVQSDYDIQMKRYYAYKQVLGLCKPYEIPESNEDAEWKWMRKHVYKKMLENYRDDGVSETNESIEMERMWETELKRGRESEIVTTIKKALSILFGG